MGVEALVAGLIGNGLNGMVEGSFPILRRQIINRKIKDVTMSPPTVAPIINPTLRPSDRIVECALEVEGLSDDTVEGVFDSICVVEGAVDGFCDGLV